jgi:hypothetical protein
MTIFDINSVASLVDKIKNEITAPYINVNYSTLGGEDKVSILIMVSLDSKNQWPYGIAENSRMMRFHIHRNGKIEQFQKSYEITKKFRKATAKTNQAIIDKINKYISQLS